MKRNILWAKVSRLLLIACLYLCSVSVGFVNAQEGGRTRSAPRVTCSSTSYDIIIAIIVVTECSDGTVTVSPA